MTKEHVCDVAIVGASIAGSTAATLLAREGARVALIERHRNIDAYKVMCTNFIQPSAVPVLDRLGVLDTLNAAGAFRGDAELWTRWGWIRTPRDGSRPSGMNVRRQTLDPVLRRYAAETPGVDLMLGRAASDLVREGSRFAGVVLDDGTRVRARLVVAADGRDSRVAELAGGRTRVKPHNRFGYFAYFEDVPLSSGGNAQMWLLDPDSAYAFPTDGGLTLIACMLTKDKLADFKRAPQESFVRTIERLPDGPAIRDGRQVSKLLGKIDMPNTSRRAAHSGLAFVGDAAMASDPLWGIGCGFALQSAEWLADCMGQALAEGNSLDRALRRYRRKHRAALAGHHAMANSYATGRPFNTMERLLNSVAARDPRVAARMSLVGERWVTPRQVMTRGALWNIARASLSSGRRCQFGPGPAVARPPAAWRAR